MMHSKNQPKRVKMDDGNYYNKHDMEKIVPFSQTTIKRLWNEHPVESRKFQWWFDRANAPRKRTKYRKAPKMVVKKSKSAIVNTWLNVPESTTWGC